MLCVTFLLIVPGGIYFLKSLDHGISFCSLKKGLSRRLESSWAMWGDKASRKGLPPSIGGVLIIVVIYLFVGGGWILFSDTLVAAISPNPTVLIALQTVKGWVYVLATALMLYLLMRRNLKVTQKSQAALRESEARYQAVSELSSDYAYALYVHPDGTMALAWIAGAFTAITGYTPETISATDLWSALLHPEDKALAQLRSAVLLGNKPDTSMFRILTRQGETRWVREHARPVWDEDAGRVVQIIGAAQDITVQRQAELEIAELNRALQEHAARLEDTVAQRTAELETALAQAQAADRSKSEFVSNVSHELRTPLTSIKLYVALLSRGKAEKQSDYFQALVRETDRLQHLIESLLQISRLDLGQMQPEFKQVDLNQLVGNLVADRRPLFASHRLALQWQRSHDLLITRVDSRLLEQVLTNLLTNALNYTPPGGTVWVRTALAEAEDQRWGTVVVQDTGLGIASEERPQLFRRFYRGEASRTLNVAGTGLGLAISQEIVALHHGRITVESKLNEGSTFTLWLPLCDMSGQ